MRPGAGPPAGCGGGRGRSESRGGQDDELEPGQVQGGNLFHLCHHGDKDEKDCRLGPGLAPVRHPALLLTQISRAPRRTRPGAQPPASSNLNRAAPGPPPPQWSRLSPLTRPLSGEERVVNHRPTIFVVKEPWPKVGENPAARQKRGWQIRG